MTLLQHHVLALSLTAVTTFALGLLVLLAGPKRALNRAFALYSACVAWWGITEAFLVGASNPAAAAFWMVLEWVGVSFIAPAFLHSVLLLTGDRWRVARPIVLFGYVAGMVFVILHLFTGIVTGPPRPVGYAKYFSDLTVVGCYLPAVFTCLVTVGMRKLWQAYRAAEGQRKTQMRLLFWSLVIGFVGGSPDWALAMGFYIPGLNPFGIYGVPLYSMATTYAVLQHKLFDFHLVIRKSLVYSLVVTVLTVSYFGMIYVVERVWQGAVGYNESWVSIAAFALMALAFQPLKIGIQRGVDKLIFRMPHEELIRRVERLEQEIRQTEKMKSVATLAAGLAHEIRNPMTAIQTFMRFLPEKYDDPGFRQSCHHVVVTEIDRVNELLTQLMDFAKPNPPKIQPVDVHRLIHSTLDFMSNESLRRRIEVRRELRAEEPVVPVDGNQIRQVLLNLALNGFDAMPPGGTLTVETARHNGSFLIAVRDTGCGIPAKELPHLFDPFRTTKAHGNGLGLSVAYGLIREHRGTIAVTSQVGQGTTFTIKLPV